MRHAAAIITALCLTAAPLAAQDLDPERSTPEEGRGLSLMERGAQMFMEGIMKEVSPAFEDLSDLADQMRPALREFALEMGPKLRELLDEVDDWNAYQAPEMLPNGDIIIRRKPDHPLMTPETPTEPEPQIEL